jgi:hypothetical protein
VVAVVTSLMGQPPSLGPQSPALLGDLTVPRGRLAFSSHLHMPRGQAWCYGHTQKGAAVPDGLRRLQNTSQVEQDASMIEELLFVIRPESAP